jgi:hypothetical protein
MPLVIGVIGQGDRRLNTASGGAAGSINALPGGQREWLRH